MIGFFPDPYPDELLYSACARYANRVQYPNKQQVMKDLFGKTGLSAIVDFPTRINFLLSSLKNHNYSADQLINQNTLLPFYEPFISTERAEKIRQEMKSINENRLRTRLSTNIHQINSPKFLRFCPLCIEDDKNELGETFWHRIHQLPGILVCPEHRCFLQNSSIKWERESSYFFHTAEDYAKPKPARFINNERFKDRTFLALAEYARWLLTQKNLSLKSGELRKRYHEILLQRGYAYYNGRIQNARLFKAFNEFYPSDILEILGCSMKSSYRCWLSKILETALAEVLYHPIRHLLLMNFL